MTVKSFLTAISICVLMLLSFKQVEAAIDPTPKRVPLDNIFIAPAISGNNASVTPSGEAVITQQETNKVGALWSTENNLMDFSQDFTMIAHLNFGDRFGSAADGMMFLIQSTSGTPVWFTHSGASIGGLAGKNASDAGNGIPNSFAIEFDLYGNQNASDGFYDKDISNMYDNQHVATVWPNDISTYWTHSTGWIPVTYHNVITHDNLYNTQLANGRWTKLELTWKANQKQLSYRLNDMSVVIVDSVRFNSNVLSKGNYAYWGFTGSTGPSATAKQQVVFEQVPGLVDAEVSAKVKRDGTELTNYESIYTNELLDYEYTAKYFDGKQSWQNIVTTLKASADITLEPGTIRLAVTTGSDTTETVLSDSLWQNGVLILPKGVIPDLDKNRSQVSIKFSGRLKPEFVQSNVLVSGSFDGSNAMYQTEVLTLYPTLSLNPEISILSDQDGFILKDNDSHLFSGLFNSTDLSQVTLTHYLNGNLLAAGSGSTEGNNWQYELSSELAYPFGSNIFKVKAKDPFGNAAEASVSFIKVSTPTLSSVFMKIPEAVQGEDISIDYEWEDYDSPWVDVYYQIDDGEPHHLLKDTNDSIGNLNKRNQPIPTKNLSVGKHSLTLYLIDERENKTETVVIEFNVLGKLSLSSVPVDLFDAKLKLGGTQKSVKIYSISPIGVTDTRLNKRIWTLNARLNRNFVNEQQQEMSSQFFSYRNSKGETFYIDKNGAQIMTHQTTDAHEILLDQDGKAGFYLNPSSSDYKGTYKGTINWELVNAPE